VFWLIALVVLVVFGVVAWWSDGRQRRGVDSKSLNRTRKINEGRGTYYGG
jgi:hypothetical protein